ncbi:hypothetical protein C7293_26255 [filamentous cyanobacterium CCT1]|nr:hypothetical protein C7293_26255 [filamentous cyanobacterium CCT1]
MTDPCRNDCTEPLAFPKRLFNRPGLGQIDYRIGTYADIRAALLRQIDADPVLQTWTHREADDPGIALLEGAAILGDILTFYQTLYANEAFLRTAQWRESIADLVRLTGYLLSPGLGGRATFAVGLKGDQPITIPAGFGLKAQVEGLPNVAEFQTVAAATAHPHLSEFHLYRPRKSAQSIKAGGNRLEISKVEGKGDVASLQGLDLQKGDRLVLLSNQSEMLVVSKVEHLRDRLIVEFKGTLTYSRGSSVKAYRIGRSFRHFGHNAPAQLTRVQTIVPRRGPATQVVTQTATRFARKSCVDDAPTASQALYYSTLKADELPLDQEVDDLATGNALVVQAPFGAGQTAFAEAIQQVRVNSLKWGNLSGSTTVVRLDSGFTACKLLKEVGGNLAEREIDIRHVQLHETTSAELTLRAPSAWADGPLPDRTLNYWGTYDQARALLDRALLLRRDDGETLPVQVTTKSLSLSGRDRLHPWLWPLTLSQLGSFVQEDFDEQTPRVTVYGNLVEATQGKREKEAVLGNGDSRQSFQTFKLPKAPLTYLPDTSATPPEVPELEVFVSDRRWTQVPSFFGQDPKAEVYIVREDANGESWVQFGDGKTGARLPSGAKNIKALYRTGTGAYGALKPDTRVQASDRLAGLDQLWLPGVASGGTEPESGDNAKVAAPGKIQSLGRLVSLQDFETEAIAIAGISKAIAAWQLVDSLPSVVLTVLMATGRESEFETVRGVLATANRCRGPQRFPVLVKQGQVRYLYLRLAVSPHPAFRQDLLTQAIQSALGVSDGKGLLGLGDRPFAQPEYATRIEATVQNVAGVVWTRVEALGWFPPTDDPAALPYPTVEKDLAVVPCGPGQVLTLLPQHLQIQFVAAPQEDC